MAKQLDSSNLGYLIGKIKSAFWSKAETGNITIDATPTNASNNLVTSGGVYSALADKVTGPASATSNHVATFDGATGKLIKDSGLTLGVSVPAGAVFTDTMPTITTSGSGSVVTNIGIAGTVITQTKGEAGTVETWTVTFVDNTTATKNILLG